MSVATQKPRVLLIDDHPALLQQAIRLLRTDFEIVGSLPDGSHLTEVVASQAPDTIVLDITLPGQSGLQLAQSLLEADCKARIVFLTVHCDPDYARAALAVGALGYVVKSRMASDLILAVHSALRGDHFISPSPELEGIQ